MQRPPATNITPLQKRYIFTVTGLRPEKVFCDILWQIRLCL